MTKPQLAEYKANWYLRNRARCLEKMKAWAKSNRERANQISRNRNARDRHKIKARWVNWYSKNSVSYKQKRNGLNKQFRDSHKSDAAYVNWRRKRMAAYRLKRPDVFQRANHKRRALKNQAVINLAGLKHFFKSVRTSKRVVCYYCLNTIQGISAHFDHIIPLSQGGQHSADNLCVSCQRCNLTKQSRTPQEWIKCGQQLLAL